MEAGSIFKKYDLFATTLAKETKEQRILLYQFLIDVERQEYHKPTRQITGIDLGLK